MSAATSGARLLVVDDQADVRAVLTRILEAGGHTCRSAGSVAEAIAQVEAEAPDLVLCDIDMPGQSGLVLVEHLHRTAVDVAVLMVTAYDDPAVADQAMDDGAYGYVIKPFERNEILINVASALRRRASAMAERSIVGALEQRVEARTAELHSSLWQLDQTSAALDHSHEEALRRLACAAEFRDPETAHHLERMSRYSAVLAGAAGLDAERTELIRVASPMHDVGKIGIPDDVLFKDGIFTPEDRLVMERHPEIGYRLLADSQSDLLDLAASVALTHHEKVDGSGYPHHLRGDDIPIEGRIVAIADVFDALTSERRYKRAMTIAEARELMVASRGSHFDADLLDLFLDQMDEVAEIQARWAELPTDIGVAV